MASFMRFSAVSKRAAPSDDAQPGHECKAATQGSTDQGS